MYVDRVEEGGIPEKAGHSSHTTDNLINGDGSDLFLGVLFLDFLKFSLLLGQDVNDLLLKGDRERLSGLVGKSLGLIRLEMGRE